MAVSAFFDFSFISLPIFIYLLRTERQTSLNFMSSRKKRNNFCSLLIREKMTVTQVLLRKKVMAAEQNSVVCGKECSLIGEPIKNPLTIIRNFFGQMAGCFQKLFQEFFKTSHYYPTNTGKTFTFFEDFTEFLYSYSFPFFCGGNLR